MKKQCLFFVCGVVLCYIALSLFESDIWYNSDTILNEVKKVNPLANELLNHERKITSSKLTVKNNSGSIQVFCLDANLRRIITISECGK